ncbi:MAG: hypothetical protein ISR47_03660 [Rhodospirillales bacterium]|nr:hypothetical protein [Rhodospirillales bacterium]
MAGPRKAKPQRKAPRKSGEPKGADAPEAAISASVRPLIPKIMADYLAFAAMDAPQDAKAFSAFHTAGKAALNHLATLIGIAKADESPSSRLPDGDETADEVEGLLNQARAALAEFEGAKFEGGDP